MSQPEQHGCGWSRRKTSLTARHWTTEADVTPTRNGGVSRFQRESGNLTKRAPPMKFSVIYSADAPVGIDVDDYAPPNVEGLWDETENDSQYEYGYLEGRWE